LNEANDLTINISDKLRKILRSINDPISNAILDNTIIGSTPGGSDITYLDCFDNKDKNDKISFLPANKVGPDMGDPFSAKGRQEISVGRIVNRLFPDKFTQPQIEKFVNDFKAELKKALVNLELVKGEEIRYWYLEDHYANKKQGDVNSSCMKGDKAQKFFDIYVKNPEKCNLLVLLNEDNKLMGRALVWVGMRKPTGRVYMDRIYTINDADKKLYIDYAIDHKWLYKAQQVMHNASYIDEGKTFFSSVSIQLDPVDHKLYPSLDTLSYYTPTTGRLASNAGNYIPNHPRIQLNGVNGQPQKVDR